MARGINTKCLHLEEEEGCCNNYGSISFPMFDVMMTDNVKARVQQPDGTYTRELAQEPLINSQEYFYEQAYEALEKAEAEEETADADSNSTKN